jgi:hypothetical protein
MDEQLFWGYQLQRSRLAPAPLPAKHATARKLADRLDAVLYSEYADEMEDFAQYAKQTVSATNGVHNAVTLIEAKLQDYNLNR